MASRSARASRLLQQFMRAPMMVQRMVRRFERAEVLADGRLRHPTAPLLSGFKAFNMGQSVLLKIETRYFAQKSLFSPFYNHL